MFESPVQVFSADARFFVESFNHYCKKVKQVETLLACVNDENIQNDIYNALDKKLFDIKPLIFKMNAELNQKIEALERVIGMSYEDVEEVVDLKKTIRVSHVKLIRLEAKNNPYVEEIKSLFKDIPFPTE